MPEAFQRGGTSQQERVPQPCIGIPVEHLVAPAQGLQQAPQGCVVGFLATGFAGRKHIQPHQPGPRAAALAQYLQGCGGVAGIRLHQHKAHARGRPGRMLAHRGHQRRGARARRAQHGNVRDRHGGGGWHVGGGWHSARRHVHIDLVGLDHAQLAARFLLDHVESVAQVAHFRGQPLVLQAGAFVGLFLRGDPFLHFLHMPDAAAARPELRLDGHEQEQQHQGNDTGIHGAQALRERGSEGSGAGTEPVQPGSAQVVERGAAGVVGDVAQVFLDAQQLVVLGDAVGTAQRTGLDLARVGAHGDVGDGGVFRFARAVRDHGRVARALGHLDGGEGFGQRPDLVDLDEDRVADALVDAFLQDLGVGDEQVVAHQLNVLAQALGQVLPAVPVAFGHAVLDGDDGVLVHPGGQHVGPLLGRQADAAFAFQHVVAVLEELAGGAVQAQGDLLAGRVAGGIDGLQDQLDGGLVVLDAGGEAAFVAHGGAHALVVDDLLQGVEHLGAPAHGLAEARGPHGDDHEFLQVQAVVGMRAAVDHVHHRHGQLHAAHAAQVAVQRQAGLFCGGAGHGHGDGQHGVGAQAALVVGAVQVDQRLVQEGLLGGVQAQHGLGDLGVDVLDGLEHALAQVAALVAVAQFDGFAAAGGGSGGHGRAAHHARFQQHVALDGGVAAAVQHFAADDINDGTHGFPLGSLMTG